MKPQVTMIEGRHLTAADKRNILDCIEYLRAQDRLDHPFPLLSRPGSPKRYALGPHKAGSSFYAVIIKTAEKSDYGAPQERTGQYLVKVGGLDPLPWDRLLGFPQEQLNTELTEAGEQWVIPGCERNTSPRASQLDLFG